MDRILPTAILFSLLLGGHALAGTEKDGARLFKDRCSFCHNARPLDRQGPPPLRRDKGPDLVLKYAEAPDRFDRWVQDDAARTRGTYCKARALPLEDLDSLQRFLFTVAQPIPPERAERRLREVQQHLDRSGGGTAYDKGGTP